jgi:hypothetical protein
MGITKTHVSRQQAAEYTGFSAATLAKWGVCGRGPKFSKLGTGKSSRVRYALADLERFLSGESGEAGAR